MSLAAVAGFALGALAGMPVATTPERVAWWAWLGAVVGCAVLVVTLPSDGTGED